MPSDRLLRILALATLPMVVGVVRPAVGWAVVAFDVLLLVAWSLDLARARRTTLAATRTWPPTLYQGTLCEVQVDLRRPAGAGRPVAVRLRETLHPALADGPRRHDVLLSETVRWTWEITPRRRGEHEAGPLVVRILGPWGLAWHQRTLLPPESRRVYPQVRWDGRVGRLLLLAHRRALGHHPRRQRGSGSEFYALREYLPGDPPHRIQWKASARHGRLVSREDTWERGARLVVLVDCARAMSGLDGRRSKLDHALAAALALIRVAAARGDRVALVAFSDRIERAVRIHGDAASLREAYGRVFDLETRRVEPAFDLAAERAVELESRRSTVVLLTSVVDLAAAELLRRSLLRLEKRHRPILVNLQDPELVACAHEPPRRAADAFARVAALEILLANRRLASRLRHAGIRVVSPAADQLALETLEAYLALFGGPRTRSRAREG